VAATIDDYRWLVSEAAVPWLEEGSAVLRSTMGSGGELAKLALNFRRELSAERTHLVLEQIELRQRAKEKFSLAERMFFTRKGLEQATDEQLAANKAERFSAEQPIVDLCCGIGGDLVALARRGNVTGIDADEIAALLTSANAAANGLSAEQCSVAVKDAVGVPLAGCAWHCDPDRRREGKRTTRGELFQPPLEALDGLLAQSSDAAVKLAPATDAPPSWQEVAELEWLSSRGECRQQVAWFGRLARHAGRRAATVVHADGTTRTIAGLPDEAVPVASSIGRYVYEPDAAVLAARLNSALSAEHSLAAISAGVAYLTGDYLVEDVALDAFEVVDVLPLDRKQLKTYCREHRLGRLEIKKRGVDVSPEQLRKQIVAEGDEAATIIVATVEERVRAIVARRMNRWGGS
jgi:SAM-dependent methyltransferase